MDCPIISTDNQVETENNPQNFLNIISTQQGELLVIYSPSTQQLFPRKHFIAESGLSINSEQSSPGNVFLNLYHKWCTKALSHFLEEIQALEKYSFCKHSEATKPISHSKLWPLKI